MKAFMCSSKNEGSGTKRLIINANTRATAIELARNYFMRDSRVFSTCVALDSDGLEEIVYEFMENEPR